ncbi:ABC transporter ATP-binding protein [Clostridium frigidicarnis]|uniref:Putative ABC transport system ATP-binding protein n=1 Tax=Clostridium frigidicarnis TaxID=84698 RepID=A0A1I0XRL9_9CLOT|nr:ATP-binding cassette domain-containing protein [Clostridium frigidicarnis]SFB02930.1 putative ABC transport system ATP-binding protein [Clostridium frigidicarnis]
MLKITELNKAFNKKTINEKDVFKAFNIDVNKGDFITIIGSNGAGKSTLLNIISGVLPLDSGDIILDNKSITSLKEFKRTKVIGRVFQDPSLGVSPSMTILENLSMAYNKNKRFNLTKGVEKKNIEMFKELLKDLNLGLENKLDIKVSLLSGGQRQALSLIIATLSNPKLLLLDEHTAALDPKTSENIINITEKVVKEKNITTLMVTHNLKHAISVGNRLIMLHEGRIVLDVSKDEKKNLTIDKILKLFNENKDNDILSDRTLFS